MEQYMAVTRVGIFLSNELLDHGNDFLDMVCGLRHDVWRTHSEGCHILCIGNSEAFS